MFNSSHIEQTRPDPMRSLVHLDLSVNFRGISEKDMGFLCSFVCFFVVFFNRLNGPQIFDLRALHEIAN